MVISPSSEKIVFFFKSGAAKSENTIYLDQEVEIVLHLAPNSTNFLFFFINSLMIFFKFLGADP